MLAPALFSPRVLGHCGWAQEFLLQSPKRRPVGPLSNSLKSARIWSASLFASGPRSRSPTGHTQLTGRNHFHLSLLLGSAGALRCKSAISLPTTTPRLSGRLSSSGDRCGGCSGAGATWARHASCSFCRANISFGLLVGLVSLVGCEFVAAAGQSRADATRTPQSAMRGPRWTRSEPSALVGLLSGARSLHWRAARLWLRRKASRAGPSGGAAWRRTFRWSGERDWGAEDTELRSRGRLPQS